MSSSSSGGEPLKILALHGSEGDEHTFSERLQPLCDSMKGKGVELDMTAITAPFPKGPGYAWWTMEPGVRSFNADVYEGFEESSALVSSCLEKGFDAVFAHSQGAILISALLGLNRIPVHPVRGYILNGVAWPNPYAKELSGVQLEDQPRVLFLMGEKDRINPIESAQQVLKSLETAGCVVSTHRHRGGHSPPTDDEESMEFVSEWLLR